MNRDAITDLPYSIEQLIERGLRQGPPAEPRYQRDLVLPSAGVRTSGTLRVGLGPAMRGLPTRPLAGPPSYPRMVRTPTAASLPRTRSAWIVALIALLGVAIVAAAIIGAPRLTSIVNGPIAIEQRGDIFVWDPSVGGEKTNLTNTPTVTELGPRWSPDGRLIAFRLNSVHRVFPYVMNADGTGARRLADIDCEPVTWLSNDVVVCRQWGPSVYLLPVNGGLPSVLFSAGEHQANLADVTEDGSRVLVEVASFQQSPTDPYQILAFESDFHVVEVNSGASRGLTDDAEWKSQSNWSPDGRLIAFSSAGDVGRGLPGRIEVIGSDGGGRRVVVEERPNTFVRSPTWSPDGQQLLYETLSTEPGVANGIWVTNAYGTETRPFADGLTIAGPRALNVEYSLPLSESAWSPDGELLVVHDTNRARPRLFTLRLDGAGMEELLDCICSFDWLGMRR